MYAACFLYTTRAIEVNWGQLKSNGSGGGGGEEVLYGRTRWNEKGKSLMVLLFGLMLLDSFSASLASWDDVNESDHVYREMWYWLRLCWCYLCRWAYYDEDFVMIFWLMLVIKLLIIMANATVKSVILAQNRWALVRKTIRQWRAVNCPLNVSKYD